MVLALSERCLSVKSEIVLYDQKMPLDIILQLVPLKFSWNDLMNFSELQKFNVVGEYKGTEEVL
jgi:hypothetical protein